MKKAILYIRVSTDEQAERGYSQRNQDEVLHKYCELKAIQVHDVIYEDHSAKTFNRPAWNAMLVKIKKNKGANAPQLILFTKWDRFSRNAGDAYQMIALLRNYGIEPQAIEQPLDLSIPENKMMLAFYLAAPEVENDRRALNIFHGMRRAKKEGRWVATAPIGYANKTTENGHKYIRPSEPQAGIMKRAFTEIATGKYAVEQVWKQAKGNGLKCGRNNFWNMIRNPVYYGKIVVPSFKDENLQLVEGQHEPIITFELFHKVQDVLDGKKSIKGTKVVSPELLPLRGFLVCPKCGRMLTGSASKGRNRYYYYYHCSSMCGIRFKADQVNNSLIVELRKYIARVEFLNLFKKIFKDVAGVQMETKQQQYKVTVKQIEDQRGRFNRAKDLLLSGDLDADDYRSIKKESEDKMTVLQNVLSTLSDPMEAVDKLLKKQEKMLLSLALLYQKASAVDRRKIIGFLYPENLIYTGACFEIKRLGDVLKLMYKSGI
jgi:site-specific DNA recombinase